MDKLEFPPHVLIFPFSAQGHVNSMLKLAQLLCLADIHVTFLVTLSTHDRLLRHTDINSRFNNYKGFQLKALPAGVYDGEISTSWGILKMFDSLKAIGEPFLTKLLAQSLTDSHVKPPITCVISDGIYSFAIDIAEDVGIPIIYFRTVSASAFWAYFCVSELLEAGELPIKDMDAFVTKVKGMEDFLRARDLPSLCRFEGLPSPVIIRMTAETLQTARTKGLILNTFDDLEGPILSQIRTQLPNLYTIGPIQAHLKARLAAHSPNAPDASSNSLWEEDRSCIRWLDEQPPKSVIYVSFGSIAVVTRNQLLEFWHGLVNSGKKFLWVVRRDLIVGEDGETRVPTELDEGTKTRGYMVSWAPQEEVLRHPAIGGFLTHSGWNSTLESIMEAVPMICWPYFADQQTNSRFVGELWKLGLDMKDTCDRVIIEKMVRDLMEERSDEFMRRSDHMAKLARKAISEGGSSYCNLNRLIDDIKSRRLPS